MKGRGKSRTGQKRNHFDRSVCEKARLKTETKREIINIGTIGDFVATFASLRPLEASENKIKTE